MDIQKTIVLLPIIVVLIIATSGFGATLATPSEVDQIKSLQVLTTTSKPVIGMDMGTGDTITSIVFTFHKDLNKNTTVSVSIRDTAGTEIGSGSATTFSKTDTITIVLSDTVNASERLDVASVTVTI